MDFLLTLLFLWLFLKSLKLIFRVAWGTAKIVAAVLFALALPMLGVCLVFAGGVLLLVPVVLAGIAFGILNACV